MKKELIFKKLFAIILSIIAIGYVSCTKPEKEKDYREKWVGTYECEEIYFFGRGTSDNYIVTEEMYQTSVIVTAKGDSILHFFYNRDGDGYEIKINKNGEFGEGVGYRKYMSGNFYADSLSIHFLRGYSPAGRSTSDYKGRKHQNKKQ